jgi:hypothetical protein
VDYLNLFYSFYDHHGNLGVMGGIDKKILDDKLIASLILGVWISSNHFGIKIDKEGVES